MSRGGKADARQFIRVGFTQAAELVEGRPWAWDSNTKSGQALALALALAPAPDPALTLGPALTPPLAQIATAISFTRLRQAFGALVSG